MTIHPLHLFLKSKRKIPDNKPEGNNFVSLSGNNISHLTKTDNYGIYTTRITICTQCAGTAY